MKTIVLGLITAASLLVAVPAFACGDHADATAEETTASTTTEETATEKHADACDGDCGGDCAGKKAKADTTKGAGEA